MSEEKIFMRVDEVAETLGISKSHAYKIVHQLNKEMAQMGYITVSGRINMLYGIGPEDRMFQVTKSYLYREMKRGSKEAGVKCIRVHDIRHSAVSLLIDMGFSATAIADRVGHESIEITYNYAHMFPSRQAEMADKLDVERGIENVSQKPR